MTDPRTIVLSWLRTLTRGKPSTAVVTIPVSELLDLEGQLRDAPKGKRAGRRKALVKVNNRRPTRSKKYLAFVRSKPCCVPGCDTPRYRVEANHFGAKSDKGWARKPPDDQTVPLCWNHHHGEFHRTGGCLPGMTKAETLTHFWRVRSGLQIEWEAMQETGHPNVRERNNQGEEF